MKGCSKTKDSIDCRVFAVAPHAKARRGMTLIEVVLAMLILAILAVMVPGALRHPRFQVVSATQKEAAILVANEVLEKALALDYDEVSEMNLDIDDQYAMAGRAVSVDTEVQEEDWGGDVVFKRVTVEVAVDYPGLQDDPVILETLVAP